MCERGARGYNGEGGKDKWSPYRCERRREGHPLPGRFRVEESPTPGNHVGLGGVGAGAQRLPTECQLLPSALRRMSSIRSRAECSPQRLKQVFKIDLETCEACSGAVKGIRSTEDASVFE